MEKKKESGIEISTNLFYLPVNENNLAYRAARLLMDEFDIHTGVKISLTKHIPVAAGMAGGSSNAAAVLYGMNRMYGLGLSMEELMERGRHPGGGRALLHHAGDSAGGRDRRDPDAAACHAKVPDRGGQASGQCLYQDGV